MTPRERIGQLEGLLDRIHRNAARPRAERAVPAAKASAPAAAAPIPVVVTPPAPAVVAAASVPTPPPVPQTPAAPPVAVAQAASSVPPWKPEPSSTVQARPSTIPPEELSEDDLIEVTSLPPVPPSERALEASSGVAGGDELEEAPASSRRSKVAESLDQAIANAAAQADDALVPIHTPPPESGPQEAVLPAGIEAPRAPEFGDLDEALNRPASLGPTPEQLGETIDLDEAEGPTIEIEAGGMEPPEPPRERQLEELEVALPRAEMPSGTYDLEVSEPAPVPEVLPPPPLAAPHHTPQVTARPAVAEPEITQVVRVSAKAPETFAELLDASLGL